MAGPEHNRVDHQPQLVDEVVLYQRAHQATAGGDDDFPAQLLPQLRDLMYHIAGQDRGVVPGRIDER